MPAAVLASYQMKQPPCQAAAAAPAPLTVAHGDDEEAHAYCCTWRAANSLEKKRSC